MKRTVKINEELYYMFILGKDVINEGVDWTTDNDGNINMSINQKMDNNSNKGTNSVDTRVFGTKDDILHGKKLTKNGEANIRTKSLEQNYLAKQSAIQFYQDVIKYIENNRQGEIIKPENIEDRTYNTVMGWLQRGDSDRRIIDACKKSINRISAEAKQTSLTYNRVNNTPTNSPSDKIARYITGIVPNTDVKYISLFSMTDFNFSDAIKHGTVRQNGNTDKLLGITDNERPLDKEGNLKVLDITYDNGIKPNVAQNFSLNNVQPGHYKQQYDLNGGGQYSTVNQFLDKSVNYAAYALKQENFIPDYIVSAPSSSKFNEYYCNNLSHKLGVPYEKNFFKRNVINVRYANGEDLANKGFSPKDIMEFESQARNIAFNEIAYLISEPMRRFVNDNYEIFSNISLQSHSREKTNISDVFDCIMLYSYHTIVETLDEKDFLSNYLVKTFMQAQGKLNRKYDSRHIYNEVVSRIKLKIGQRYFNNILMQIRELVLQYAETLKTRGFKLRFDAKRFKITSFKKQFRPFLSNIYIIADEYMNDGELMTRYRNAKFLIFDEDINSGATLKIVIDALQEKLPEQNDNNLMCLVNAYSGSGF